MSFCLVIAGLELLNVHIHAFYVFLIVVNAFFGMRERGPPTKSFTIVVAGEKGTLRMAR